LADTLEEDGNPESAFADSVPPGHVVASVKLDGMTPAETLSPRRATLAPASPASPTVNSEQAATSQASPEEGTRAEEATAAATPSTAAPNTGAALAGPSPSCDLSQGQWLQAPLLLNERCDASAAAIGPRIYLCGGQYDSYHGEEEGWVHERLTSLHLLDASPNEEEELQWGPPLREMDLPRNHATAAACEGMLYVCGGTDGSHSFNSCERYDPSKKRWAELAPMHHRREQLASVELDGKLYVMGGYDESKAFHYTSSTDRDGLSPRASEMEPKNMSSMESFDPSTGRWTEEPPMRARRRGATAGVLGGKIYVCGGMDQDGHRRDTERYDPETQEWTEVAAMSVRRTHAAGAVLDGRLVVCGGYDERDAEGGHVDHDICHDSMEAYDPVMDTWTLLPPMKAPRGGHVAVAVGHKLFVFGGCKDGCSPPTKGGEVFVLPVAV